VQIKTKLLAGLCLVFLSPLFFSVGTAGAHTQATGPWVYLRADEPLSSTEDLVEILAVGDVMPGRGVAGLPGIFDRVAGELQDADLLVGNLEGVLLDSPPEGSGTSLSIPTTRADDLAAAGFDLLGLANNHTLDAGPQGLADTLVRLQTAGIQPLELAQPVVRTVEGLKIAFLAWNEVPPPVDRSPLWSALESARTQADILVVQVHWGWEYQRHPNQDQRSLAVELLAAGADLVLGSHSHVVQDIQFEPPAEPGGSARLVAYSLGNFVFDQGWDDTGQGLALRLFFDRAGLRAAQALPLWSALRPRWLAPDEATDLLARILPASRRGFTCQVDTCHPAQVPQEEQNGIFWSGAIDLTGDGRPEFVRRVGASVEVYQDGSLAWRSPSDWHVLDLALGDPNEDGRYELLLVLEQRGSQGETTSHPFVIGYRGGLYRQLWGGSPAADPLYEVEMGDLDGDGTTEVAILEACQDQTTRCLTVWRWHGWGFRLDWRSEPGDYHDLVILPAEGDTPARLSISVDP
jgi:hypothetical protein